ncbi:anti-sigma factor family protein [Methylobrevis pamukkalensis]|uniref:Transmembrane transcriptional regulator (Anti-sigma factor) n=1 Tax=Methylobrevis pamukkalensis TaxID=1439726 RepID=A0A1E3H546_9HYPH|nr:hypothetical protein [Methylobrevis pamukkalensis]ODN71449.1 hypothetical protein A6302_01226 [Methylobrevis pamukkalensis]
MEDRRPVTDDDLHAYVDDQLDPARRLDVEEYLASRPEKAAEVMADLARRDGLREMFGGPVEVPPALRSKAAAVEAGIVSRSTRRRFGRVAAAAVLVASGWLAHAAVWAPSTSIAAAPPPSFVEDATHAYRTALLRSQLKSQPDVSDFDRQELVLGTGIELPAFPDDWKVRDIQVFPAREGHSIEVALDTPDHGPLFLFAASVARFDVAAPSATPTEAGNSVYWQVGNSAYVLSGTLPEQVIAREAVLLATSFN